MPRRPAIAFAAALLVLAGAAIATAPPELANRARAPELRGSLDAWLAANERAAADRSPIIPGAEKRIRWFDGRRDSRTGLSVVYLHGFSATRQEVAPLGQLVADALGANLFETRLSGHGHSENPLAGVRAEDWLEDAAEALAIGAAIGERVVLMGTSTGAALALAMAGHPAFDHIGAVVLLSPNFGPGDTGAEFLTWPGGRQIAHLVAGETRTWQPHNALQGRYWSTAYPMDAAMEMMRLVKYVRGRLPMRLDAPLQVIYSPADRVVDTGRILAAYEQIDSRGKELVALPGSGDPANHVLAGDILAPENNGTVSHLIVAFVRSRRGD